MEERHQPLIFMLDRRGHDVSEASLHDFQSKLNLCTPLYPMVDRIRHTCTSSMRVEGQHIAELYKSRISQAVAVVYWACPFPCIACRDDARESETLVEI